jgi:hypothetical protein
MVVDRFSKHGHFTTIKHPYTALQVALKCSLKTFLDWTACPHPLYVIRTPLSIVTFGENCFISMASSLNSAAHTTHKLMAKRRLLSRRMKCTSGASRALTQNSGLNGYHGLSFVTIQVFIPPQREHHLKLFMAVLHHILSYVPSTTKNATVE